MKHAFETDGKKNPLGGLLNRLSGDDWGWLELVYDNRLWIQALNEDDVLLPAPSSPAHSPA